MIGKGVTIFSNDEMTPRILVSVRAEVVGSVLLLPGYKGMVSNRQPETRTQHFIIRKDSRESGELRIARVSSTLPWVEVDARELKEKHPSQRGVPAGWPGDWLLTATLGKDAPNGTHKGEIRFETGLEREPEVELDLSALVQPPVNLNSPDVQLIVGQPQVVLASFRRDLDPQTPVEVRAPDGLSARVEPGRGRFFKLHLEWSGQPPSRPVELQLEVAGETLTTSVTVNAAD